GRRDRRGRAPGRRADGGVPDAHARRHRPDDGGHGHRYHRDGRAAPTRSGMSPVWTNTPLVVALAATVVAQVVKVLLVALTERRWVFERLLETGGMPSSHSAAVTALG